MKTGAPQASSGWRYGYVDAAQCAPRRRRSTRARPTVAGDQPVRVPARERSARRSERRGVALVAVITSVAILAVFVAELIENTTTDLHVAIAERDRVKAEYLAKSGINLTRLLIAREPQIRAAVAGFYKMLVKRDPPQLNVWDFADMLLAPFADYKSAKESNDGTGIDFGLMQGIRDTGGTFEVIAVPENAKINLNSPLFYSGVEASKSIAMQLFALLGGNQSPDSPYDPMFSQRDADGQFTTRLDIVSDVIDWWDVDENRTVFDPGSKAIGAGGSEDDVYSTFRDPYVVKNSPMDSLEELRMIRGIGDDFWATFIEPNPDDPRDRKVTIYGSGAVNANLAPPDVLLSRVCSFVHDQPLCNDPVQQLSFMTLFSTMRAFLPIALFSTPKDFVDFISGGSNATGMNLYAMLSMLAPAEMAGWTPMQIPADQRQQIEAKFLTEASIFTIQSVGRVGKAQAKISVVVNLDRPWVPPPGVPGSLPALGVFHHYRIQ
jgi:general secretion pathway protein K